LLSESLAIPAASVILPGRALCETAITLMSQGLNSYLLLNTSTIVSVVAKVFKGILKTWSLGIWEDCRKERRKE
jgi:hypothetical protein